MNIYITLDYELFFGNSGTPEKCIIEPTERLISIVDKFNFKCVFFVDSGYLIKLRKYSQQYPKLENDYKAVSNQIKKLSDKGHDVQLHIHPHWEDTVYDGNQWNFDTTRYRLDSFSENEIIDIFGRYKGILEEITGKQVFAYRAGGWCIQPFSKLKKAFKEYNINVDSTVFYKGKNTTKTQWFDFTEAKDEDYWNFEDNPCISDKKGSFLELPIASYKVSPWFFWRFALTKKIGRAIHTSIGDGISSRASKQQIMRLLTRSSYSVVSIDGYKIRFLNKAFKKYKNQRKDNFVIIGHPKAFTEYSLLKLNNFLKILNSCNDHNVKIFKNINE